MKKFCQAWKNRKKIIEGIKNFLFPNSYIERIAEERMTICESNVCGFFDKDGTSDKVYVKGSAGCMACGCKLSWKCRSLSSSCGLDGTGQVPLWTAVMNEKEEHEFRTKSKIKNE